MDSSEDYKFETYEGYFGSAEDVTKSINYCSSCGGRLTLSHYPDSGNLIVQETSQCTSCDKGKMKVIHVLN